MAVLNDSLIASWLSITTRCSVCNVCSSVLSFATVMGGLNLFAAIQIVIMMKPWNGLLAWLNWTSSITYDSVAQPKWGGTATDLLPVSLICYKVCSLCVGDILESIWLRVTTYNCLCLLQLLISWTWLLHFCSCCYHVIVTIFVTGCYSTHTDTKSKRRVKQPCHQNHPT